MLKILATPLCLVLILWVIELNLTALLLIYNLIVRIPIMGALLGDISKSFWLKNVRTFAKDKI